MSTQFRSEPDELAGGPTASRSAADRNTPANTTADRTAGPAAATAPASSSPPPKGRRSFSAAVQNRISSLSLRSRVSLLVMAAVGLTVALISVISYMAIRSQITNNLDNRLFTQAESVAGTTLGNANDNNGMGTSAGTLILNIAGLRGALLAENGRSLQPPTQTPQGQPLPDATIPYPFSADEIAVASGTESSSVRTAVIDGTSYRIVAVPDAQMNRAAGGTSGYALLLATSMADTEWTLNLLSLVFSLIGLAGIIMAGIAGLAVAKTALRPVNRLTVATEYIAQTGDLRRIEVTGTDELARLTVSFNTMLEALARSQDHQRRLVADAGHELRTPLTSMRTNLDLLAQAMAQAEQEPDRPRLSAQDRAELMGDVRAQMEELSVLISDLVELSRDEHPSHQVELLDLAEVIGRAVERVQRRAPDLHYDLRLEPWYLPGDPAALERAVTNLLDNAAKFSPPAGTVSVRLSGGALEVADQGPGIDEADLTHVFERFYRSPEARTMPGSGLGLAIVRQVAENHGGRVAAARAPGTADRPGGALLGVWLPGSAQPPQ
ncbi:MAG TPA: HAMP domain-containing sensor histidine kinase [Actinocrinis sp.]|nr:HAMP domain-containing sensor histidine kinase [Actinocrinis sp.]